MSDLGLGNEEYHIMAPSIGVSLVLYGKKNVILSLILVRFYGSMPTIIDISSPISINICQLIGNSDIYERVHPFLAVSQDVINMQNTNYSPVPNFQSLCQKYTPTPLQ